MKKDDMKEILSVREIKEYLGIGINQVYELLAQERIKHKKVGRRILIQKKDLFAWLDSEDEAI